MANQTFDFGRASDLQTKLEAERVNIEADLNKMMKMVEGVRDWWKGGSEEAFIQNFQGTKVKMLNSLNTCINNYKTLVQDISKAKTDSDADIARQLR